MLGNVSILLVEDNDVVRRSMADYLLNLGYFVTGASTGIEALGYFRELLPDLIITDLMMPEMGGLKFLKIVKNESELTPFIIVSGEGTMEDVIEGLRLGAWDYLTKPIHPLELLKQSVERALERAQLLRQTQYHKDYLEKVIEQRTADLLEQNGILAKEIRERQQEQEELIEKVRNEWRRTVDALPDMIAIVDLEHRVIRLNTAMREMLDRPYEEIIGQDCLMCRNALHCQHTESAEDRKPRMVEICDGDVSYSLHLSPYFSVDGELIGSVHVFHDISELKKTMKEQEILHAQLLQAHKLESVGQLASGIAHEINTPTQFVSSNVGFLDEAFADVQKMVGTLVNVSAQKAIITADDLSQALETADWPYLEKEIPMAIQQSREGLSRVANLVRAMKEFSHPGGSEAVNVDINHLIETTVTVARNEWKYSSEVQLNLAPDLPGVFCLAGEIGQVLLNLLVNAAHAITEKLGRTPEGGKGLITIKTEVDGPSVLIHITDSGCGIPDFARAKIFDPFFTTKGVGRGTGQGLAIAYDVVTHKHGGALTFSTAVGEGTTFTIRLPMKKNVNIS